MTDDQQQALQVPIGSKFGFVTQYLFFYERLIAGGRKRAIVLNFASGLLGNFGHAHGSTKAAFKFPGFVGPSRVRTIISTCLPAEVGEYAQWVLEPDGS